MEAIRTFINFGFSFRTIFPQHMERLHLKERQMLCHCPMFRNDDGARSKKVLERVFFHTPTGQSPSIWELRPAKKTSSAWVVSHQSCFPETACSTRKVRRYGATAILITSTFLSYSKPSFSFSPSICQNELITTIEGFYNISFKGQITTS